MHIDPANDRAMQARVDGGRRRPAQRLIPALLALAGNRAEVVRHRERAWASVTFSGARHAVTLRFCGAEALEAGETFVANLPDHEFEIPRQLVAQATVASVVQDFHPVPTLTVEAELLLIEEA